MLGRRTGLVLIDEFFDILVDSPGHSSLLCLFLPLFGHPAMCLYHDFEMLVQDLNVRLAAHPFEQEIHFEVSESHDATQVFHVSHEGPSLLAHNLRDPGPVLRSYFVQKECEQEELHSVCVEAATARKVSLLKIKLGVQSLNNLDPEVINDLFRNQLRIKLTFEQFKHPW